QKSKRRISDSLALAMKIGKGTSMIEDPEQSEKASKHASQSELRSPLRGVGGLYYYSRHLMCPTSGISYDEPQPNSFSFNSPYGACRKCNGLGTISEIDLKSIIPDSKMSIKAGGIVPLGAQKDNWIFKQVIALGRKYGFTLSQPIGEISEEALNVILYGSDDVLSVYSD